MADEETRDQQPPTLVFLLLILTLSHTPPAKTDRLKSYPRALNWNSFGLSTVCVCAWKWALQSPSPVPLRWHHPPSCRLATPYIRVLAPRTHPLGHRVCHELIVIAFVV